MEYTLFFLLALGVATKAAAFLDTKYYPTGTAAVNKGVLYDLGNGFQGRYSSIRSNDTGLDVASALWFINATNEEYHLCLLEFSNFSTPINSAPAQILWCANNGSIIHRPVRTGATLTFQADGNLVLKDTRGISVFETGTAGRGAIYLGIDYYFNIRLIRNDSFVVWKSQKHPLNALAISQVFTPNMRLTSWSNSTNNSRGPYSMVMETGGVALYYDDSPYWVLSNDSMNTIQSVKHASVQLYAYLCAGNGYKAALVLSSNSSNIYVSGETSCYPSGSLDKMFYLGSTVLRKYAFTTFVKLEPDGNLGAYYWDNENYNWTRFFQLFESSCDLPGSCGDYGVCENGKCNCPYSFIAKSLGMGCELHKHTTGFQDLKGVTYFSNC